MKINYVYDDTFRTTDISFDRVELVIDPDEPTRVWIYLLDENHERTEGGSFNMVEFMEWVMHFYHANF